MFSLHIGDNAAALPIIRDSWSVLPNGYMFANADFMPSEMGGGDNNIDCILRSDRMSELMVSILRHEEESQPVILIAVGKIGFILMYIDSQETESLRAESDSP